MPEFTDSEVAATTFTLWLRKPSDGSLVNTGGDVLTESPAGSRRFIATVAESWTETLEAHVDNGTIVVRDGTLDPGDTQVRDVSVLAILQYLEMDHLLKTAYDPGSKPGDATALLNVIVENDGGVPRFTANALEQAPAGGGGGTSVSTRMLSTTIAAVTSQTVFTLTAGSADNAYGDALIVITDAATSTQKAMVEVLSYVGASRTVTLYEAPAFIIAPGDTVEVFAQPSRRLRQLQTAMATVQTAVAAGAIVVTPRPPGLIRMVRGRDYLEALGNQFTFQPKDRKGNVITDGWPDLTGATITLSAGLDDVSAMIVGTGSVQAATGTQLVYGQFAAAASSDVAAGTYQYELKAVLPSGHTVSLDSGTLELSHDYAA